MRRCQKGVEGAGRNVWPVFAALAVAGACSGDSKGPTTEDPFGEYQLAQVDGTPPPVEVVVPGTRCTEFEQSATQMATSGSLTLDAFGGFTLRYQLQEQCRPAAGPPVNRTGSVEFTGTFALDGADAVFYVPGANAAEPGTHYSAQIEASAMLISIGGAVHRFTRRAVPFPQFGTAGPDH